MLHLLRATSSLPKGTATKLLDKHRVALGALMMRLGRRIMPAYDRHCIDLVINIGMSAVQMFEEMQQKGPSTEAPEAPSSMPSLSSYVDAAPSPEELNELISTGRTLPEALEYWAITHKVRLN